MIIMKRGRVKCGKSERGKRWVDGGREGGAREDDASPEDTCNGTVSTLNNKNNAGLTPCGTLFHCTRFPHIFSSRGSPALLSPHFLPRYRVRFKSSSRVAHDRDRRVRMQALVVPI